MKKIIATILSVALIIAAAAMPANAAEIKKDNATDYPYVFVHGMGGWGPDNSFYDISPYWGGGLSVGSGTDLIKILNEQGIEAYAPSVGPLSSAWDRACELYAQLTGTVVDYGEAHSKSHNHDRYGFDYTGKATMGEPWDLKEKINLVGHSFGGATVRLLTSLLAYGDADEVAATGDDTSPLFTGGHDCVHSCITLSAPHNGSQVANILVDPQITMLLISAVLNVVGAIFGNEFLVFSFQLGHHGLTPEEDEFRAWINPVSIWNFYASNDNCGYDMTLRGAAELNEKIKLAPNTYYYSYTTVNTEEGKLLGYQLPGEGLSPIFYISSAMLSLSKGFTVDGIKIEGDWEVNDGIVPFASAIYPSCDAETALSYEDEIEKGNKIKPGRWYYFEPMTGMDHFDFCGTKDYPMGFEAFWFGMINTANSR
ncbi:MAG: hypothetical protein IJD49_08820 [Clostridia bacterium]|nr:hypothetical protein [Clostridia bacterium]